MSGYTYTSPNHTRKRYTAAQAQALKSDPKYAEFYDPAYLASVGLKRFPNPDRLKNAYHLYQQYRLAKDEYGMNVPPTFEVYGLAGAVTKVLERYRTA